MTRWLADLPDAFPVLRDLWGGAVLLATLLAVWVAVALWGA